MTDGEIRAERARVLDRMRTLAQRLADERGATMLIVHAIGSPNLQIVYDGCQARDDLTDDLFVPRRTR